MKRRAGFSLIEALLSCALLGIVLVPVLSTFRTHLTAATRMRAQLRLEQTLAIRLAESELRILDGRPGARASGFQPDGLHVLEHPLDPLLCGTNLLWRIDIEVSDRQENITRSSTRWLIHSPEVSEKEARQ